ncbi:Transcriptional regulator, TetR family [Leucobacter sp. 7(1)]|nr:Transcriptional regulator, TetR family [Leucobacter sp. 7(1)]
MELSDVLRAGRQIGLRDLSLSAVAGKLGVSTTALYRHVDGRWGLERLIGEDILGELELQDDPAQGVVPHLLSSTLQLRAFLLTHPGLAGYVQTLFPRGAGGRRVLAAAGEALERRGYAPEAAVVLFAAVASLAIGFAAAEEAQRARDEGFDDARREAHGALHTDPRLERSHRDLPEIDAEEYVRMWLGAAIRGCVTAAPPGMTLNEMRAALHAAGEDH